MNRFFIDPLLIQGNHICLPDDISSQIRKVLRLKEGESIMLLDNAGSAYLSELHYIDNKILYAEIIEKRKAESEPSCCISLYISLTQREKFEWILQKCTEAGVSNIIPVTTERTLIRKSSYALEKKERWEKILKEAAEQCGRGSIPVLKEPENFEQAIKTGLSSNISLLFWEAEQQNTLRDVLAPVKRSAREISLMIGPEGGFSDEEAESALHAGWLPVTLGKRIYRMETAAMASVILVLYELESS